MPTQSDPDAAGADFLIIGGGIAGASVGYFLAPHGRVVLLERESQPGYHSTGRSAALFLESYGTPQVRALTRASRAFLATPPAGFAEHPLLGPRGCLLVAAPGQEQELQAHWDLLRAMTPHARRLSADEALELVPVLRRDRLVGAVLEPDASDMDVHAIHQGYLRGLRRAGGSVVCDAEVTALERVQDGWQVRTRAGNWRAPVVINAAGAWADVVAALAGVAPIGLQPKRRSAFTFTPPPGTGPAPLALPDQRRRDLVREARRRHAARLARQRRPGAAAGRAARGARHRTGDRPHRADDDLGYPPPGADLGRTAVLRRRRRPGGRLRSGGAGFLLACRAGRLRHPDLAGDG
jgi:glycine/D-amino acid oxidase-like deaminating enzyme